MSAISNPNSDGPLASKQVSGQISDPTTVQNEELTGLPFFKSWRGVYFFVFGCFLVWVLLLLALTASYS